MHRPFLVGILSLLTLALASGCAGVSPSGVGQTAGTIVGSIVAPGVGAPIGALAGLLAGIVVQDGVDKANEKRERKTLSDELAHGGVHPTEPASTPPQGSPVRVWVDETVQNGRIIAGHFETRVLQ